MKESRRLMIRNQKSESQRYNPASPSEFRLMLMPDLLMLGRRQQLVGVLEALGKDAHHLDRDGWEIGDHAEEQILGDLERGQVFGCNDGRGARHVAQDADLAHE